MPDGHVDKMPVKPIETKSIYQIAAEKAMERFKDIKIGDEYMTMFGRKEIATRLPEIIGNSENCFIDCGVGYLWQYNKPGKFGYKLISQPRTQYPFTPDDAYPLLYNLADLQVPIKEIQPTESITNQLLNIKLNNY